MFNDNKRLKSITSRIPLTEKIQDDFHKNVFRGSVSKLSRQKGLPYDLIYNLVNKRVKSITLREYRFLFGKEPPRQDSKRVDGTYFRQMVDLWIFLNGNTTKADLYREFFGGSRNSKTDYRLFSGHIFTVEVRLEKMMVEKFLANSLDEASLKLWVHELESQGEEQKIPYENIRPILFFLSDTVGIHPTACRR